MPQDRDDPPAATNPAAPPAASPAAPPAASPAAPTPADFDQAFSAAAASPGIRRAWQLAERRAALFGLADRARFVVGDLARTGLPEASADAIVCVDAFHFASDPAAAATEARRILRPGRRLVLTNWQPKVPGDTRLPSRIRIDWFRLLRSAGFADVETEARPEWHDTWTNLYRVALDLGDLQDEGRKHLALADLLHRVTVTATAPTR